MIVISFLIAIAYSLLCIAWPDKVREWFLKGHKVDAPSLWYKPNTWLTVKPGILTFRIFGLVVLILSLLLLYLWISSKQAVQQP